MLPFMSWQLIPNGGGRHQSAGHRGVEQCGDGGHAASQRYAVTQSFRACRLPGVFLAGVIVVSLSLSLSQSSKLLVLVFSLSHLRNQTANLFHGFDGQRKIHTWSMQLATEDVNVNITAPRSLGSACECECLPAVLRLWRHLWAIDGTQSLRAIARCCPPIDV